MSPIGKPAGRCNSYFIKLCFGHEPQPGHKHFVHRKSFIYLIPTLEDLLLKTLEITAL